MEMHMLPVAMDVTVANVILVVGWIGFALVVAAVVMGEACKRVRAWLGGRK